MVSTKPSRRITLIRVRRLSPFAAMACSSLPNQMLGSSPSSEVENAGYYGNGEMVQRLKTAKIRRTEFSEPLSIRLRDGEVINLPVGDDFLTIAKIIHERAAVYRSQERRTIRG